MAIHIFSSLIKYHGLSCAVFGYIVIASIIAILDLYFFVCIASLYKKFKELTLLKERNNNVMIAVTEISDDPPKYSKY